MSEPARKDGMICVDFSSISFLNMRRIIDVGGHHSPFASIYVLVCLFLLHRLEDVKLSVLCVTLKHVSGARCLVVFYETAGHDLRELGPMIVSYIRDRRSVVIAGVVLPCLSELFHPPLPGIEVDVSHDRLLTLACSPVCPRADMGVHACLTSVWGVSNDDMTSGLTTPPKTPFLPSGPLSFVCDVYLSTAPRVEVSHSLVALAQAALPLRRVLKGAMACWHDCSMRRVVTGRAFCASVAVLTGHMTNMRIAAADVNTATALAIPGTRSARDGRRRRRVHTLALGVKDGVDLGTLAHLGARLLVPQIDASVVSGAIACISAVAKHVLPEQQYDRHMLTVLQMLLPPLLTHCEGCVASASSLALIVLCMCTDECSRDSVVECVCSTAWSKSVDAEGVLVHTSASKQVVPLGVWSFCGATRLSTFVKVPWCCLSVKPLDMLLFKCLHYLAFVVARLLRGGRVQQTCGFSRDGRYAFIPVGLFGAGADSPCFVAHSEVAVAATLYAEHISFLREPVVFSVHACQLADNCNADGTCFHCDRPTVTCRSMCVCLTLASVTGALVFSPHLAPFALHALSTLMNGGTPVAPMHNPVIHLACDCFL
jgi:hypothetical protein